MKRPLLAAALLVSFGLALSRARADEGAYGSLIGMAQSASEDRGPDAGEAPARDAQMKDALKDVVARAPAPRRAAAAPAPAPRDDERGVPAASSQAPRLWTRLYATLLPTWRRAAPSRSALEPAVSTAAVRAPLPDWDAVRAGERRGLAELLSASAAPADPQ